MAKEVMNNEGHFYQYNYSLELNYYYFLTYPKGLRKLKYPLILLGKQTLKKATLL